MTRLSLKIASIMTFLFTGFIGAIRMRPYDGEFSGGIHTLVESSARCTAPCFMGIRPGVTTEREAIDLLKASEWVQNLGQVITGYGEYPNYPVQWSDRIPNIINQPFGGSLTISVDAVPVVESFEMMTTIPLAYFYIELGKPTVVYYEYRSFYAGAGTAGTAVIVHNIYNQWSFDIQSFYGCPLNFEDFLNDNGSIVSFFAPNMYPPEYTQPWSKSSLYQACS